MKRTPNRVARGSYPKGILLSLATSAAAIVPSALFHGTTFGVAIGLCVGASLLAVAIDWGNSWRYRWEPTIRPRWFYLNLTAPGVLVLVIQAIGWRVFSNSSGIAHVLAWIAAVFAVLTWIAFSYYLKKKEPNRVAGSD